MASRHFTPRRLTDDLIVSLLRTIPIGTSAAWQLRHAPRHQRPCSRNAHLHIWRRMATLYCDYDQAQPFFVQRHYGFAPAFAITLKARTNIFFRTTLDCADVNIYRSCLSRTKCDYGLSITVLYTHGPPAKRLMTGKHQLWSKTTFC